jgi:hypothetical protein
LELDCIIDKNNNVIASVDYKAVSTLNRKAGADWVAPEIANEIKNRKYNYLTSNEVGPMWMRK